LNANAYSSVHIKLEARAASLTEVVRHKVNRNVDREALVAGRRCFKLKHIKRVLGAEFDRKRAARRTAVSGKYCRTYMLRDLDGEEAKSTYASDEHAVASLDLEKAPGY
jgi:hypothetical protein